MQLDGKIGAERSVLQELCHFVIPPDLTDKNRISIGDVTHKFRTNCMLTDRDRTSNFSAHFMQWKFLNMLKTSHWTERTSPDIAEQGGDSLDMKQT